MGNLFSRGLENHGNRITRPLRQMVQLLTKTTAERPKHNKTGICPPASLWRPRTETGTMDVPTACPGTSETPSRTGRMPLARQHGATAWGSPAFWSTTNSTAFSAGVQKAMKVAKLWLGLSARTKARNMCGEIGQKKKKVFFRILRQFAIGRMFLLPSTSQSAQGVKVTISRRKASARTNQGGL